MTDAEKLRALADLWGMAPCTADMKDDDVPSFLRRIADDIERYGGTIQAFIDGLNTIKTALQNMDKPRKIR